MTTCSTHVLDASRGTPAAGLRVVLADATGATVAEDVTDADGRVRFAPMLAPGAHRIGFETGDWFAADGRDCFHPRVDVTFEATAGEHHHVALLLSPFAYTTYRGS